MQTILVWILVMNLYGKSIVIDNISSQPNCVLLANRIIEEHQQSGPRPVFSCHQIRKAVVK